MRAGIVALQHEDLAELLGHPGRDLVLTGSGAFGNPVVGHRDVERVPRPRFGGPPAARRAGRGPFAAGVEVVRQLEGAVGVDGLDALRRREMQPPPFGRVEPVKQGFPQLVVGEGAAARPDSVTQRMRRRRALSRAGVTCSASCPESAMAMLRSNSLPNTAPMVRNSIVSGARSSKRRCRISAARSRRLHVRHRARIDLPALRRGA